MRSLITSAAIFLLVSCNSQPNDRALNSPEFDTSIESPMVDFAKKRLLHALQSSSESTTYINLTQVDSLGNQSFRIDSRGDSVFISVGDVHGAMYGILELEELVMLRQPLDELSIAQDPFISKRGLKFNIPLDARNPSYDDTGDAAQENIATVWDIEFWTQYLDQMALHRYNQLTLWNPQPFTSMLKLESFPGLALDNVYRSRAPLSEKWRAWGEPGGVADHILEDLELVREISIDEKIAFWRRVLAHAKNRGIDVYLITWSIYPNGIDPKHGITSDITNLNTQAFFREAVKELIVTYPDLKGIGVTAGENMPVDGTVANWTREKWLWETYGRGLAEAKTIDPSRQIDFIHRFWYSGYEDIQTYWNSYPDPFSFSFKYLMARSYSSPKTSHLAERVIPYLADEEGKRTWWNLRNDDLFVFRWGNPDYVREFYSNLPLALTEGIHMGSDGYVWGRVFADKAPSMRGKLELDKHWYRFMMWGRLAYNHTLPRSFFENKLGHRLGTQQPSLLYDAWAAASEIIPQINRYQFRPGDRQFSPESSASRETFRYVNDFQVATPMPGSGIINPREYVRRIKEESDLSQATTPLDVADNLEHQASRALSLADQLPQAGEELSLTLQDIRAIAHLGRYYAFKIRAAVALEFFEQMGQKKEHQKEALSTIQKALETWQKYRTIATENYHPQMLARVGNLDWEALEKEVVYEVQLVQQKLLDPFIIPKTNDPQNRLFLEFDTKHVSGEARHESLKVRTPNGGPFMLEVYESSGVLINNYHSFGNGPMRWEWLQEQSGLYYLNLIWNDLNRVVKVDKRTQVDI